jgi:BlaI family transcriptional regulator, penicillinase repressor
MKKQTLKDLSKRERQIMDALFALGQGTVSDVVEKMEDPPSYSSVRVTLRIMEDKGYVRHTEKDGKYVFKPVLAPQAAGKSALDKVVQTFFGGQVERVVAALISREDTNLSDEQISELERLIQEAKRK